MDMNHDNPDLVLSATASLKSKQDLDRFIHILPKYTSIQRLAIRCIGSWQDESSKEFQQLIIALERLRTLERLAILGREAGDARDGELARTWWNEAVQEVKMTQSEFQGLPHLQGLAVLSLKCGSFFKIKNFSVSEEVSMLLTREQLQPHPSELYEDDDAE